ncbi:hypothetical protein AAFF_G00347190 [Aldrovandia affinis]|uniref:Uncharacterized protein n=1 Tax=Aldrovandia affinis TaxID=143900 RepID=A0AAD7SLV7_9TELE|nr:hypothetical protein AAFF_G00347190 [Aldrovandia affinis]
MTLNDREIQSHIHARQREVLGKLCRDDDSSEEEGDGGISSTCPRAVQLRPRKVLFAHSLTHPHSSYLQLSGSDPVFRGWISGVQNQHPDPLPPRTALQGCRTGSARRRVKRAAWRCQIPERALTGPAFSSWLGSPPHSVCSRLLLPRPTIVSLSPVLVSQELM